MRTAPGAPAYCPYKPSLGYLRHALIESVRLSNPRRFAGLGASNLLQSASSTATGAKVGAAAGTTVASAVGAGAAAGSFVPIIGTAVGAILGLVASGVFSHRVDPEVANFNSAVSLYNSQGPNAILNISDKYLVLAGLFDLQPGQIKGNIPIYKKYGRMGEYKFLYDMCMQIYQAAQAGRISPNADVQWVFDNIVQPWIASFGFGAMSDTNAGLINTLLLGLTAEYITGLYAQRWFPVGGQSGIWNSLPPFKLPASATASPPAAVPAPVATSTLPAGYTVAGTNPATGHPAVHGPNGLLYDWNQAANTLTPITPAAANPTPTVASATIPAGFLPISGAVTPAGQQVYQGPDGNYYAWTGAAMTYYQPGSAVSTPTATTAPVTGVDATTQAYLAQLAAQGATQAQATTAALQALQNQGVPITPQLQQQVGQAATAATAGLSDSTSLWIAGGLALLAVLFATARPAAAAAPGAAKARR